MSTEGPLSRLSRLLGLKPLDPIAAVKRIEEHPVSLNPECLFKMTPTPDQMSDTGVHRLYGDSLLRRKPEARAFDIKTDYASYRPEHSRWIAVDENSYDGAPDSEAPSTFIGRGASEKEARTDLLAQFAEYDNPEPAPKPRVSRVIHHSTATDPPEYANDRDVNFDDDLEDRT